jgi:FtsH-binding integral membrane protein
MLESLDGERTSSVVILLVTFALVAGLLLEVTQTVANATTLAAIFGGLLIVLYGVSAAIYLLLQPTNGSGELREDPEASE